MTISVSLPLAAMLQVPFVGRAERPPRGLSCVQAWLSRARWVPSHPWVQHPFPGRGPGTVPIGSQSPGQAGSCGTAQAAPFWAAPTLLCEARGDDMTGPLRTCFSSANQLSFSMLEERSPLNAGKKQTPGVWMHCG